MARGVFFSKDFEGATIFTGLLQVNYSSLVT